MGSIDRNKWRKDCYTDVKTICITVFYFKNINFVNLKFTKLTKIKKYTTIIGKMGGKEYGKT